MVLFRDSISRRAHSHSSTHHWQWSISYSEVPQGLSISPGSCHLTRRSSQCPVGHVTCQSLQSVQMRHFTFTYNNTALIIPCRYCCLKPRCSLLPGLCVQIPWKINSASPNRSAGRTPATALAWRAVPVHQD